MLQIIYFVRVIHCMILMRGDAANIYFHWKARHSEDSATMNLY